jgi:hypothetical protein
MKYLCLISIFFVFYLKNLSAYQEITIQKGSNLQNYQELLERINNSISGEDVISSIEKNIYNINFSSAQISLNIDVDNLSSDLYSRNIDHNLLLINCSIKNTFFKLNNKFENCPNFVIKNYDNDSYIYLNYKKNYFRLAKFSENISLKTIWIKLFDKSKTSYQLSINPSKYNKLKYFTGLKPKILSYEQNNIILEFENFFNNKQINFLINFF